VLEVSGVDAGYGRVQVLWDVDLEVGDGEVVALVGSNGAGKTTLLRAVSGMIEPTGGDVRLGGDSLPGRAPEEVVRAGIAHVPEGRRLFAGLTVRENLRVGAYASGGDADIDRAVELFPRLGERLDQAGGTLSGGEQQMLAIGRALMSDPRVLLLDEPSLGLAPKSVRQIFDAISEIARGGLTILLVEQNTRLALETAHQAHVLVTGEVSLSGASRALREDPRVRAAYLGEDVNV
jgi:branched-chain amino acid transport system ATP-binding protein